jgi:hypothetical protein
VAIRFGWYLIPIGAVAWALFFLPAQASAEGGKRCVTEGQKFSGKDPGRTCCQGLTRLDTDQPAAAPGQRIEGYAPGCEPGEPPDSKICARCGNGRCGPGENRCNCMVDCT